MASELGNRPPEISRRAARAISLLVKKHAPTDAAYMPLICWASDSTEPTFVPGPCLALEVASKIPAELVVEVHGIKVVFHMPEAILANYRSSVLDYIEDRFLFVSKGVAEFFDQD